MYILLGFSYEDFGSKNYLEKTIKYKLNDVEAKQKNKWYYFLIIKILT